jgi:hypothetical protein
MGVEKLVSIAVGIVMLAAATGQLPRLMMEVHKAQYYLLRESWASNWGSPNFLYRFERKVKNTTAADI